MTSSHKRPPPRPSVRAQLPAHIVGVAALLIEVDGYDALTMERLASEAGVSKRTLYKYFPVKGALLEQVLEAELAHDLSARQHGSRARTGFRASAAALLRESARWCERHADVLLPYIRYKFASFEPAAASAQDNGLLPVWAGLIAAAQRQGELSARRRPEQLAFYFHYLYLGALMRWLTYPGVDLAEEFDTMLGLFLHGAAAPGTRSVASRPAARTARR